MPRTDRSLVKSYLQSHPEANWAIYLWTHLANRTDEAHQLSYSFEDWLKTDRSAQPPDLVKWFSLYGYIDLRLDTWKLPIQLTDAEKEQWRQAGYYVTLDDFYHALAGVAGGIAEVAGANPLITVQLIQRQLDEKLAELKRLADLPIDEHYTPRWQKWQFREYAAKQFGLSGKQLDDYVEEEVDEYEDMHDNEVKRFDKPFELRQQLESFEWAMENLRMIVLGEPDPKTGKPDKQLFEELFKIDLNGLIAQLHEIDEKLKKIWQNLAKYKCYCLNAEHEPERFWWRHYKAHPAKKRPHTKQR